MAEPTQKVMPFAPRPELSREAMQFIVRLPIGCRRQVPDSLPDRNSGSPAMPRQHCSQLPELALAAKRASRGYPADDHLEQSASYQAGIALEG
jgi:hypothetical protein